MSVVSTVCWEHDEVVSKIWLTDDYSSSSRAHNSAVPDASQISSTSDRSDPAATTHA